MLFQLLLMILKLVPTRVGMIPIMSNKMELKPSCPHTRGDDPGQVVLERLKKDLSPHAWG